MPIPVRQEPRQTTSSRATALASPTKGIHFTVQKKGNQQNSQTAPSTGIDFPIQKKENAKHVSNQLTSGTAPIQRYAVTPDGKLSQRGYLLLQGTTELYATPEKIGEANHIGGQIIFEAGAKKQPGHHSLYKVLPLAKKGTELERETTTFQKGDNEKQEEAGVKERALKKLPDLEELQDEFKDFIKDHLKEARESPEKARAIFGEGVDPHNIQELRKLKEALAELAHAIIQTIGVPVLERRIDTYIESQVRDRPLMPSDCRQMASYVAGFDADSQGVETDEIAAGNVYEYKTDNKHAEWPFHYATIIMTDGADHVTMENAAAKASDHFSKKQYDRSWFFEMYGAAKGQRFDDKYGPDMEKGKDD